MKKPNKNAIVLFSLMAILGIMLGIVSQAEPLYKMFCGATGLGGTTQRAAQGPAPQPSGSGQALDSVGKDRVVRVTFDANVDPSLPWEFFPDVKNVNVTLGEVRTVTFHARNLGGTTLVGTAVHNVQPDKAGLYFDKIQCFCFTKQTLKPGESRTFTVQFYVDPAMAENHNNNDVTDITLSYTFYLAKDQAKSHPMQEVHATSAQKLSRSSEP